MKLFAKQWLIDALIYSVKAIFFAAGSYFLIYVVYGGIHISFFAWTAIVFLAFAVAYVPFLMRKTKNHKLSNL